jgi:diguanylate cyclase (GGDEF)-like protein/PAS domain S-box-containing protein
VEVTDAEQWIDFAFAQVLFESLPLGIVLQNQQGRITQANPAAQRILGLTFDQLRGVTSIDPRWHAVHEDDSPFPGQDHPSMQALRSGRTINNVVMGVCNPEQEDSTWIRVDAIPIKNSQGDVKSVYTVFRDITESREAIKLRDASEQRFRSLFTTMSEGMALHRLIKDANSVPVDYVILDANPAFEAQTGIQRAKVVGRTATVAYGQATVPYLDIYSRVALGGEPTSFESYFAPLGKHFRIKVFSPEADHFATVFEDVTELKRFHEAMRLQSEITSNAALGISLVLADGTLHFVNKRFEALFGYGPGELKGRHVSIINAPTSISPQAKVALIMSALETKGTWSGEVFNRRKDGSTFWTEAIISMFDEPELGRVWITYQSDITERKQALQTIQQYQTVFEHADWGMVIADASTNQITRVNAAFARMHGYDRDELIGTSIFSMYAPAEIEKFVGWAQIVAEQGFHSFETVHIRKDGSHFPCILNVTVFKDSSGDVTFRAATIEDITERKQIEGALKHSEQRHRLLAENSHDVIWTLDVQTMTFTYVSPSVQRLRGYTAAEVMSRPVDDALTTYSAALVRATMEKMLTKIAAGDLSNLTQVSEVDQPHRDGSIVHTEVVTSFLLDESGQPVSVLGITRDITERKKAQEEQQLAALVYRTSGEAMVVTDALGLIDSVNPAFENITGYKLNEVKGKNPKVLASGRHGKSFYEGMWHDINATGCWQGEIWNRRKSGEIYLEALSINTVFSPDGSVYRRVALFSDITKKKEAADLIWQQANFDLLTELPNRRMFRDRLEQEMKKANRAEQQIAILFIDLDHFKEVNDTLGHVKGDMLIVEAARRVVACVRDTDTVARMGGDEFTVLLTELDDVGSVERAALAILEQMAVPFQVGESVVYISASLGITVYPNDSTDIDELLKQADQAMYVAKKAGRNRYSFFTQHLQKEAMIRLKMISDLRSAVILGQLRLHFQPIIDIGGGKVLKAEALVRWQHPERGLVSPAEFISIAEETGLICEIGDWVFREAVRWTQRWRTLIDSKFQVTVNRSPVEFIREESKGVWLEHLAKVGLPGANIVVEVTEGVLVDSDSPALESLLVSRKGGIEVAIDDFGTGYSSLAYLKKFDIDYLKIDQSFIRHLAVGSSDLALSKAIIVMAHELGLKVIAEGVETDEQLDLLRAAGCDFAQGYLFSRPLPPEEFETFVGSAARQS